MRRSEIFESFVKIAEEKGLVSKATPETNKEYLEKHHRADSLSIDDIAKLYKKKPDAPKEMQYERNIVEIAHPNPLVLTPSYDKLNSLIENVNERQDILLHIVNKTNNGQITQHKYAKNLILSLVRVGNEMDNRGESDLVALSDTCLLQATAAPLKKKAQLQVMVPLIAALVGGFYAKQHLRFHSDGFTRDYEKAIAELDDLINSNSNWGVGYDYTPQFIEKLNEIKNKLNDLNTAVQAVLPELDKLEEPHTGPELAQLAKQPSAHEALHALQEFKKVVADAYPYLYIVVRDFSNPGYKQRQIQNKGWMTGVVDSAEVLHGGKGLVADDFDDVAHALQTLFYDVANIEKSLQGADSFAAAAQQTLQQANATMPGGAEEASTEPEPGTTAIPLPTAGEMAGGGAEQTPAANPVQQDQAEQLSKELDNWSYSDLVGG
jgi:hypothetical protein